MLIEIIGPSGIGKTSVLNNVQDIWKDRILFPDHFDAAMKEKIVSNNIEETIKSLQDNDSIMNKYTSIALDIISRNNMLPSQKYDVISFIRQSYKQLMQARLLSDHYEYILSDELLLHRANSFLHLSKNTKNDSKLYYNAAPAPDAVIMFTAPVDTIYLRNQLREGGGGGGETVM